MFIVFSIDSQTPVPFFQQVGTCTFQFLPYLQSAEIEKPQTHFQPPPNNSSSNFVPLLREKHNAKSDFKLMGCDALPNCFILEDYSRQIGIDLVNQELHGYLNPYTYEINRILFFLQRGSVDRRLLPPLRRSKTRSTRASRRVQRRVLQDYRQRVRALRADRLASRRALLRVFASRALLSLLSRIYLRHFGTPRGEMRGRSRQERAIS